MEKQESQGVLVSQTSLSKEDLVTGVFGNKLNLRFGAVNSGISLALLAVSVFGMFLIFSDEGSDTLYCSLVDENSNRKTCGFKYTCFFLSVILLLPYLYEAVQAADLFIGGRIDEVKADNILEKVMKASVLENFGRAW
eukprot:CAMPEP_0204829578 /NCGR_PEP_ID=MMETSP1346-20131115/7824_1 /ASSEMBLY_ACC=CAM_ASM_000771 /TAXON_ID=215587 /ORGANISM="Aplanochytrium stocchinoi, Strain GSBS06" /LENGTH=137 /DNA_ID=CAMNT_0051959499 /DNA_START=150 /DNA_END=560 /DNA_ORIENTATION=-